MITPAGHYLGRKPDATDFRDRRYAAVHSDALAVQPPSSASLRSMLPPCFDQGQEGSCGPNAGAGLMSYLFPEDKAPFSRNQIYWSVRSVEDDTGEDAGVETRDVLKVLCDTGAAPEALWPYDQHTLFTAPPATVLTAAAQFKLNSYSRLTDQAHFMSCLGVDRVPFLLGFTCFASIDSPDLARTGVMPMPNPSEQVVGGHDVLPVGYVTNFRSTDIFKKSGVDPALVSDIALEIRNSWGPNWGDGGHFWMPMPYAIDSTLANDAWTGRRYVTPVTLRSAVPTLQLSATQLAAGDAAARAALNAISSWESSMISDDEIKSVVSKVGTIIINTK